MMKKIFSLLTVFIISVLMSSVVLAAVTVDFVKVNGDIVSDTSSTEIYDYVRGGGFDVKVRLSSSLNLTNVEVEAALRGVDNKDNVDDITDTFNMKAGVSYTKELTLPLKGKMDQKQYKLRIIITADGMNSDTRFYEIDLAVPENDVEIKEVVLSPNTEVRAGRALLATAYLRNRGLTDEDGVKVVVSIPKLGVSATDFIDNLEKEGDDDDHATTEEMFLRIPDNAETGEYDVNVDVYFEDGDKKNSYTTSIFVLGEENAAVQEEPKAEDKTIITVAAGSQNVAQGGAEAAYPIALTNAGASSKIYTLRADGAASANLRVSPSNVLVIGAGESKAFTVFASANKNAPAGDQTFTVTISSGDKVLKQLPLTMNVQEGASGVSKLKKGLEVGLVILVILLVIIGLIIGFSKLRGEDEGEGKEDEKTYY